MPSKIHRPLLFAFMLLPISSGRGMADVIQLIGGGELRGQLVEETSRAVQHENTPLTIRTPSGAIVSVGREQADFVERRSEVIEEYITRSRSIARTVDAHWELAGWCRSHLLKEQREEQLSLLLEIDPDHAEARRILGYVKHRGQWMTDEEVMSRRGYVKYKNKWITPQELALIESDVNQRETEIEWYPKVRLWLGWLTGSDAGRSRTAVKEFHGIQDNAAVPALRKLMESHSNVNVRKLYVQILGAIDGNETIYALVDRFLFDTHELIRHEALSYLKTKESAVAVSALASALTNNSNQIVRRAATGLAGLGDISAVPALIDALVTTHKVSFTRTEPVQAINLSVSSDGGISSGAGLQPGKNISPELYGALVTGQATLLPNPMLPTQTMTYTANVPIKNVEVLVALETLTGRNLGFNERDWYLWWSEQKS